MIYKKSWKYILIKDKIYIYKYYRLKAVKNFSNVKKGKPGGFVKGYHNLSQSGDCWVYESAVVIDGAEIHGFMTIKRGIISKKR